jgi:hypothetical protein
MKVVGNLQVLGNRSILQFNPDIQTNLEYSGWITNEYVEVAVTPSQALHFNTTTNKWRLAQANALSTLPCRGISLETKQAGQLCKILRYGTLRNDAWTLNGNLYVSATAAGGLTTVAPSTTGQFVQLIATPTNAKVAFFDFCPICIEIA